jgi:sialidase-1
MASLIHIPGGGPKGRLLFSNPHNLKRDSTGQEISGAHGDRKNLSIKISTDDGQTWGAPKPVETGSGAYSDLALLPDGTTLCFYERKNLLTIARLKAEWLEEASAVVEPARKDTTNGAASK